VNILVPPDIVPVKRVSPIRVKKRTVWREKPEGEPIDRGREWMSDNLFVVDSKASQLRGLVTSSCTVHVIAAVAVIIFLVTQAHRVPPLAKVSAPLVMPAMLAFIPVAEASTPQPAPKAARPSAPKPVPQPPAAAPPPLTSSHEETPAPIEAPSTIAPDSASNDNGPQGVDGGVEGGVAVRVRSTRTLDIFGEIFNVTDRVNFDNPTGDRRSGQFLVPTTLRGGGFPRQFQLGARLGF
jgi:hypothetical protein